MKHEVTYPTSSSVGCTCHWSVEVPLGHSKPDAFLDHLNSCTCGRVWEGHPNPHAITCPRHVVTPPTGGDDRG